jgi:curved DNA-binding protein CbpA
MDPWRVLGLERGSSKEEIKRAFRKKVLHVHPDRHLNSSDRVKMEAEATFKTLKEAYDQLLKGTGGGSRAEGTSRAGYSAYQYNRPGYQHTEYYRNRAKGNRNYWGSRIGEFIRHFRDTGSLAVTMVVAGVLVAGATSLDPILRDMWVARNKGKLFEDMKLDIERHKAWKKEQHDLEKDDGGSLSVETNKV